MNTLRLNSDMTRKDWLRLRKIGIGGSDAGVILGVSPYRSVLELYQDKISSEVTEEAETEAAYWGNVMEPIVREEFERRSGLEVHQVPYLLQHEDCTFMIANLDGMVHDPVHGKCVFEAKTSSAYKKDEWDRGIPETYYAQLQHYLAVTDWDGAYIAALIGGNEFIYRFVARNEEYIEDLIVKEELFWECVKNKKEPEADGSKATEEYIKNKYSVANTNTAITLDSNNQKWVIQYKEASAEMKGAENKKKEAANNLKKLMGEHEIAYIGNNIIRWSNETRHEIDVQRLKMEFPDIYQEYLKESQQRKIYVKCS